MEHGGVEYCFQCSEYPCEKYKYIDDFDSFITHQNQKSDLEKAQLIGMDAYNAEQTEKSRILDILLSGYNDGRRKALFCAAVNLLDVHELREALRKIEHRADMETLTLKERGAFVASLLQDAAAKKNIDLKLRKKK